jgi:hypothetical protein
VALPAVLTATLAACGDDDGDSASPPSEDQAAETAAAVCGLLVDWSNDLTGTMNATSKTVTDADDPATAGPDLVAGIDEMIDQARGHVDQARDLDIPDIADHDRLVDELAAGAEASITELEEGRAEVEALPPIDVAGQPGAIGGVLNTVESAKSVVEPDIGGYDDADLQQAFRDEPDCAHVIQPFDAPG